MKIVIAPNALKESLSAAQAAAAIARGLRRAAAGGGFALELIELPIADGGDGTGDVLRRALGGRRVRLRAADPLGEPVATDYTWIPRSRDAGDGPLALIDLASASGLWRLAPERRDPLRTTTRGTGELAAHALRRGARALAIALGGSATVDGATGLATALGFRFLDARERELPPGGGALTALARIEPPPDYEALCALDWRALSDVRNPLLGRQGAARVFGPQKGASPAAVERLEEGLALLAQRIKRDLGREVFRLAGGGAAGGAAAGLAGMLGARLVPGADWVLDQLDFERHLRGAAWLITAEGRLDAQSLRGKAPLTAARRAREAGVPTLALAGAVELEPARLRAEGIAAALALPPGPSELADCLRHAGPWLERLAEAAGALILTSAEGAPPGLARLDTLEGRP